MTYIRWSADDQHHAVRWTPVLWPRGLPRPTPGGAVLSEQKSSVARDPEQAWFWTPEWQAGEREADEDIAAGRYERYHSMEEFTASLRAIPPAPGV